MTNELEHADAKKVDAALTHLKNGNIAEAEPILLDVCSRCPHDYQFEILEGDTRYVKCWDMMEFTVYCGAQPDGGDKVVAWILSAYPRACYYLAYVLIEKDDFPSAIQWLMKGQSMEPWNPRFFRELGVAYAHMKDHKQALICYEQAANLPGISRHDRALALRGMGVQLIDLRRLDEAETRLKESLELDANNANTKRELLYISQLRAKIS
jgi:tetratricopeptide (TPR) repeat protein